jgi:hypothetical protein
MKVNLEFDDLEDAMPHIHGSNYYCALWDIKESLRNTLKYAELTDCQHDVYEELERKFYDILEHNNATL